jgi:zinc D-Ala-D-Ala dipeptidase
VRIFQKHLGWLIVAMCACSSKPQVEEHRSAIVPHASARYAATRNMVDIRTFLPEVVCDLRYATTRNVSGKAIYPADMPCYMYASTAEKLKVAQKLLHSEGYGLKIWDAWRPPEAQLELYRHGGHTGMFVDPRECWSKHCSGVSVDLTLVDQYGRELLMPTYFDEGGSKANCIYIGDNPVIRENLHILQRAMKKAGFAMLIGEWWHFDDADCSEPDVAPPPVMFAKEAGIVLRSQKN